MKKQYLVILAWVGIPIMTTSTVITLWLMPRYESSNPMLYVGAVGYWTFGITLALAPIWLVVFLCWYFYRRGKNDARMEDSRK